MILELKQGIARELKKMYPNTPVYFNSTQQGTNPPCFYIFKIQKPQARGVNKRRYYLIQFDIIYCIEDALTDNESQLIEVSDKLDSIDTFDYMVKEGNQWVSKGVINIIDTTDDINDNELHYKINCRLDYLLEESNEKVEDTEYELKGAE